MNTEQSNESSPNVLRTAKSISEVVTCGLCIGCGLCEAVTRGGVQMTMTDYGSLRPTPLDGFEPQETSQLLGACPGIEVEPRAYPGVETDPIWGAFTDMRYAWAGDPDLRFRAATGGVLSALSVHLLETAKAGFILHVGADPKHPMRNRWVLSERPSEIIANAGSRYGPAAALAGLGTALDRGRPFAVIAKPCDLNAVQRFARVDPRIDELCVARLTMVCGGQSRLEKSMDILSEYGLCENEVTLFRYRGYGNPGRTRIETQDGRAFEKTYTELWQDEAGWKLETRCKLCPDALGESADIAAADVWPDAGPVGEDAGFNGIVVRSRSAEELVENARASGHLVLGPSIAARDFDGYQPHQVRKKESLAARYEGLARAGMPIINAPGLRVEELGLRLPRPSYSKEVDGTLKRIRQGRFSEPPPIVRSRSG